MTSAREKQLEAALAQFLKPIKGIPFEVIIKALCGFEVEKFDTSTVANKTLLATITAAMTDACATVQQTPIVRPRPNEVGNDMEAIVIAALCARGLKAGKPKTASGKGKLSGYPDVLIERAGLPDTYLEVKSFATGKAHTSFRSFYLSPSDDPKITSDGHHLLVGFEMNTQENQFRPVAFELVDLYGLDCDMKAEFNSDNRRLYEKSRILTQVRL